MSAKTFINVLRFELSPDTRRQIQSSVDPLFKHARPVSRVDVTIEGEYTDNTRILYNITVRAQLPDEVLFELKQGDKMLTTVQAAVIAIEERLREHSPLSST
ncbi:hypothetical protein CMV30_18205 [Nibricoccus aquaticus]|uniref:Ribosomal subunit interface protein n=1 Tax=Nibricoccus aquaticus TaxID=2576891 RepID=A0A290QBA1_9BACT|nr:HPF/RaiA family ribosome-associated protein [Nibricoccus aquaticus]ATC65723.1 hypothetical protein CMV30_18205 [Nibricoccus aquaticus]